MKTAIISRQAFASAIETAKQVVEKRNTIPILSNVRLIARDGNLLVTGTDLDIETTITMPAGAIDSDFVTTIPCHALSDIVKKAPPGDDLAIDVNNSEGVHSAALDFDGLRITMQALDEKDYPEMNMSPEVIEFEINTATFRDALQRVEFAISTEETRYYFNGIYMHAVASGNSAKLRMVATDGHRLSVHDAESSDGSPIPDFPGVIVPRKTISHLIKVTGKGAPETMRVIVNHAKVRFVVGNVTVVSKLIDGTFPDYGRVLPESFARNVTINRKAMIEAIKAVSTVSNERGRAVKLEFLSDTVLQLTVNNPDMGKATFKIECAGENMEGFEIGVNQSYALDILTTLSTDDVEIAFNDSGSPIMFNRAETTRMILMPMRV